VFDNGSVSATVSLAVTAVISAVVVPAVSFALAIALARRAQRYQSRAALYERLMVAFHYQLQEARLTYPNQGEEPKDHLTVREIAEANAATKLHASQEVAILVSEFNIAVGDVHRHSMAMGGLANARARGLHPDEEESLRQESAYLPFYNWSLQFASESLNRIQEQMQRELHGRIPRRSRRVKKMVVQSQRRVDRVVLPRDKIIGLPILPVDDASSNTPSRVAAAPDTTAADGGEV